MIRFLLWLLGGILLGGVVHLATVLLLPRMASQDAYSRLAPLTPVNKVVLIPAPSPDKATMPRSRLAKFLSLAGVCMRR